MSIAWCFPRQALRMLQQSLGWLESRDAFVEAQVRTCDGHHVRM